MARITITVECDNAAFDRSPFEEAARIIRETSKDLENLGQWQEYGKLLKDTNGNFCGQLVVEGERENPDDDEDYDDEEEE